VGRPARHGRAAQGVAVVVLVAMLGTVWVSDYRFPHPAHQRAGLVADREQVRGAVRAPSPAG